MMNSMNNVDFVKNLVQSEIAPLAVETVDRYQVAFVVAPADVHHLLLKLRNAGWIQLSYLSAVDWPEENRFEVVYIVFNWDLPVYVQVRAKIDRDHPVIDSVLPIYPGAKYYERECHEFFGVCFPGNPDYEKQLILEGWDDIPPLRKDFDPQAYSDRKFPQRVYTADFSVTDEKNTKLTKRQLRKQRAASLRGGTQQ